MQDRSLDKVFSTFLILQLKKTEPRAAELSKDIRLRCKGGGGEGVAKGKEVAKG